MRVCVHSEKDKIKSDRWCSCDSEVEVEGAAAGNEVKGVWKRRPKSIGGSFRVVHAQFTVLLSFLIYICHRMR